MKKWLKISLLILVGFVFGAAAGRWSTFHHRKDHRGFQGKRFEKKMQWFGKKLNLTPDQKTEIKQIFKSKHEKIRSIRAETKPRMDKFRAETMDEIKAVLNAKQWEKFSKMEKRRDKRRQKRHRKQYD